MKTVFFGIYRKLADDKIIRLATSEDLSSFPFFTRSTIREYLLFGSRTCCHQVDLDSRQTITIPDIDFEFHTHALCNGLCGVFVTEINYPKYTAFTHINHQLLTYQNKYPLWTLDTQDQKSQYEFQKPDEKLLKVQHHLDDVKDIMTRNISLIIKRGENLESLLEKSDDLSKHAGDYWKNAKKLNKCCKYY